MRWGAPWLNYPNILISLYGNAITILILLSPIDASRPDSDTPLQSHSDVQWPKVLLFAIHCLELHADPTCVSSYCYRLDRALE